MACRSCQKHKSAQDLEAKGFDSQTGKGKCPCGQSYVGAPIDTCPRHWNMGLKTPEDVIEYLKKEELEKSEEKVVDSKEILESVVDEVDEVEVVSEEKENAPKKSTKKKAKKKAKKKIAKKNSN